MLLTTEHTNDKHGVPHGGGWRGRIVRFGRVAARIWAPVFMFASLGVLAGIIGMGGSSFPEPAGGGLGVSDYATALFVLQTWGMVWLGLLAWLASVRAGGSATDTVRGKPRHPAEAWISGVWWIGAAAIGLFIGGVHQATVGPMQQTAMVVSQYTLYNATVYPAATAATGDVATAGGADCRAVKAGLAPLQKAWSKPYAGVNNHGLAGVLFMAAARNAYVGGCIDARQLFAFNAAWQDILARDRGTWTWLFKTLPVGWTGGHAVSLADMASLVAGDATLSRGRWCEAQGLRLLGPAATGKQMVAVDNYCGGLHDGRQPITRAADYTLPPGWRKQVLPGA